MQYLPKNEANLLTLPRSDVGLPALMMPPTGANTTGPNSSSTRTAYPSLLLLQLPPQWNAEDVKDARFVIPPQQQASLVVEGQDTSFVLQRVETSNALVLVAPSSPSESTFTSQSKDPDDNDDAEEYSVMQPSSSSPAKRRKVVMTTTEKGLTLRPVPARLLNQGSGAFFLEAKTEPLRLADLVQQLPVWDPYSDDNHDKDAAAVMISTERLGNQLAKSRAEIVQGLRTVQALSDREKGHCRLAEEVKLDVLDTVLATLVEAFPHYRTEGIPLPEFVKSAIVRLPQTLRDNKVLAELLIKHCLGTLTKNSSNDDDDETTLQLDVARVGVAVACRILTRQQVWEESLFFDKWQEEMPGVQDKISARWLVGHAVRVAEAENDGTGTTTASHKEEHPRKERNHTTTTYYWKSLPCSAVVENAKDASVVWERLIQAKPNWTAVALEPYLEAWQRYTGEVPAAILRHASIRTEGDVRIYHAR